MKKHQLIKKFTNEIISEKQRKNRITTTQITNTMILSAINLAFTNESCKSSGAPKKSQRIYEKLDDKSIDLIQNCFQKNTLKFLKVLKLFSRNRKFVISFDTTKEAFYGDFSKAKEPLYLHSGSIAKESYFYYEFLTVAITGNCLQKFILDGVIVKRGMYIPDWVSKRISWIKKELPLEVILFDRGFTSKELVYELNKLKIPYLIFWRKHGNWHKPIFKKLKDGELKIYTRKDKFYRKKYDYNVNLNFVFIKQLEYKNKKYDWLFATNLNLKKAEDYVKKYKKRWGIETIYRVTDKIRAYTTSTKSIIRYFLFMFTCFVYNIWKYFQMFIDDYFTLSNFKTNMAIYLTKLGKIYPVHYDKFEKIASEI
jgi:putative transposase